MKAVNGGITTSKGNGGKMNSDDLVQRTIAALTDSSFLKRYNIGVYQVNPDVIFKNGKSCRINVLLEYNSIGKGD